MFPWGADAERKQEGGPRDGGSGVMLGRQHPLPVVSAEEGPGWTPRAGESVSGHL